MVINVKYRIIGLALLTAFLSACNDDVTVPATLSGDGHKTPLDVSALLDAGGSSTRAANMDFASGDELLAYVRHVTATKTTTDGKTTYSAIQQVDAIGTPKLVTFLAGDMEKYNGGDIAPVGLANKQNDKDKTLGLTSTNTQQTTNLATVGQVPIYWDDFSESTNDGAKDLRTSGHYLQSYYGYCFNGGEGDNNSKGTTIQNHITAALSETAGTLGWKVDNNQSSTNTDTKAFQHSDLLWSAEQTPIAYAHVDGQGDRVHGTLVLPYTHAMSKVTINVTIDGTFGSEGVNFSRVKTTLHEMFTTCTCTAPTYTLSNKGTTTDVTMKNEKSGDNTAVKTCKFEAIVVPSVLSVVNNLATIEGLDGNNYVIPITDNMLQATTDANNKQIGWGWELTETEEHISGGTAQAPGTRSTEIPQGKGYEMKSGVNYVLNVNISKQAVTVSATIKDWTKVEAEGKGIILFNNDVNGTGTIASELQNRGFDVYKNRVNTAFSEKTTTLTWDQTNSKWTYNPTIYWGGQQDNSYFRAISPSNASLTMAQGTDMLWGYACDDDANNGSKVGTTDEVAITPRTGDVPLHFLHPMSKISVELKTSTDDAKKVNLTGAKLSIINLYDKGTLSIATGAIGGLDYSNASEPYTFKDQDFDANFKWSDKIVIPQSLIKDKDGNDRTVAPTFYDSGELTAIYNSKNTEYDERYGGTEHNVTANTSLGSGTATTYLTTDLVFVEAVRFADADASMIIEHNKTLPGHVLAGDDKEPSRLYTYEEYIAISGNENVTTAEFDALQDTEKTKPAVTYTDDEANAYNATLDGAWHVGDVKIPAHYKLPATTPTPHVAGEQKSNGDMIMMYLTLADGTRYRVELSKCVVAETGVPVTAWERNKHYTYIITVEKEQITFRAMIKNWDEVTGSGSANLDWD